MQGRVTKKELPNLKSETYTYENKTSRLKTRIDAKGQNFNYSYNLDNTLASHSVSNVPSGTAAVAPLSLGWDPVYRRVTSWTDGDGTTGIDYVPYDSSDTVYGDGQIQSVGSLFSVGAMSYTYDKLGRRVGSTMDGANAITRAFDSLDRLTTVTNDLGTFKYTYNGPTDRVTKVVAGNGAVTNFTYGTSSQDFVLQSIENLNAPGGSLLSRFQYNIDDAGRITEWDQQLGTASTATPWTFRYDGSDRLVSAVKSLSGVGTQWNWLFDRAGNRLSQQIEDFTGATNTVKRESYTVNSGDQITKTASGGPLHVSGHLDKDGKIDQASGMVKAVTDPTTHNFDAWVPSSSLSAGSVAATDYGSNTATQAVSLAHAANTISRPSLTYDANGNLTQIVTVAADGSSTTTRKYEWDALNQLVAVEEPGAWRSEFTYDGLGRRVTVVERNGSGAFLEARRFVWDGQRIVAAANWKGEDVLQYYYPEGELQGVLFGTTTAYYYTKDHLGSVREVTNASAQHVARYEYDPYGQVTRTFGSDTTGPRFDFLYTGHFYHAKSGMYLAPYRAYEPRLGRWISPEPTGADGPNLYEYSKSSPMVFIDPDGLYHLPFPIPLSPLFPTSPIPLPSVQNIPIIRPVHTIKSKDLHIDTDGTGPSHGNPNHKDELSDPRVNCNSDKYPYVAYPGRKQAGRNLWGTWGVLSTPHGVGIGRALDSQEDNKTCEVSVYMATSMGYQMLPTKDGPSAVWPHTGQADVPSTITYWEVIW